jgi:hypothetical protein
MDKIYSSETLVDFQRDAWRCTSEEINTHRQSCGNLIPYTINDSLEIRSWRGHYNVRENWSPEYSGEFSIILQVSVMMH